MALSTDVQNTTGTLRFTLTHWVADIRAAFAKRAMYNRTFEELNSLSDRELSDLGLVRAQISQIAYETAYGA